MRSLPLACLLSDNERVPHQRQLQEMLGPAIQEVVELEDGFAMRFPADDQWVRALMDPIVSERACCPFLRLELQADPHMGPIWLRLRGPDGVKAFLKQRLERCNVSVSSPKG
jgi:hypothetical protein